MKYQYSDQYFYKYGHYYFGTHEYEFSAANLALAGFPLTNALGESMPSRH